MNPVYIKGMSAIAGGREIPELLKKSQLRRCPHYVKLSANAAAEAMADAELPENIDKTRIGTILASGCGSQKSNMEFSDKLVQEGPAMCSPSTFTFTVPNSCCGQICIINGLKGASTMLLGNNPLEYASLLLQLNKADYILCGAVDEMTDYIIRSIKTEAQGKLDKVKFQEGAAMILLSCLPGDKPEPVLSGINSMALTARPYASFSCVEDAQRVAQVIDKLVEETGMQPDLVYNAANGSAFDKIELAGIEQVLGKGVPQISLMLEQGDCLGASFMVAVVHAARKQMVRNSQSPVLVTGIDLKGNYVAAMIGRSIVI